MKLAQLKIGQLAFVEGLQDETLALALMEHGVQKGQIVKVMFKAPFGGPIAIAISDNLLSLRKEEAETISISIYDKDV